MLHQFTKKPFCGNQKYLKCLHVKFKILLLYTKSYPNLFYWTVCRAVMIIFYILNALFTHTTCKLHEGNLTNVYLIQSVLSMWLLSPGIVFKALSCSWQSFNNIRNEMRRSLSSDRGGAEPSKPVIWMRAPFPPLIWPLRGKPKCLAYFSQLSCERANCGCLIERFFDQSA